jgi:hypothetical protein
MTKTNADCLRLLPDRLSQLAADRLHPAQNTPQVSRSYLRDIALIKLIRTSSAKRCGNRLTFSSPLEETPRNSPSA